MPEEKLSIRFIGTGLVVSVSTARGISVVTLRGDADSFALPELCDTLARVVAQGDDAVVIDLSLVDFIDTGTARALVWTWQFLDDRGRTMTVRCPSRLARQVLALVGISHLIEGDAAPQGELAPLTEADPVFDAELRAMGRLKWSASDLYVATVRFGDVGTEADIAEHMRTGNHLPPEKRVLVTAALWDAEVAVFRGPSA